MYLASIVSTAWSDPLWAKAFTPRMHVNWEMSYSILSNIHPQFLTNLEVTKAHYHPADRKKEICEALLTLLFPDLLGERLVF